MIAHTNKCDTRFRAVVRRALRAHRSVGGLYVPPLRTANELARHLVDAIAEQVLDTGEPLLISGFGVFYRGTHKARCVRNPVTGALMKLPPSFALKFRASKATKGTGKP